MLFQFSIGDFFSSLSYGYLQRSLIATILVGVACGIIGTLVILKGLSFLGDGMAHASFAGGALSILAALNPFLTIFGFAIAAAMFVGVINERRGSVRQDAPVGVMFAFAMALAVLFVGLMTRYSVDISSLLFGSALTISIENYWYLVIFSVVVLALFFLFKKELLFITFDEEMASVSGISVKFFNFLFLMMMAAIVTVSVQAIGILLVVAMIVVPATAAYQWTYNFNKMIFLSAIFGGFSSFVGLVISFTFNLPSGATIVLTVIAIFLISFVASPKRRMSLFTSQHDQQRHVEECRYCVVAEEAQECAYCADEKTEEEHGTTDEEEK